jgi:hypothetical protein
MTALLDRNRSGTMSETPDLADISICSRQMRVQHYQLSGQKRETRETPMGKLRRWPQMPTGAMPGHNRILVILGPVISIRYMLQTDCSRKTVVHRERSALALITCPSHGSVHFTPAKAATTTGASLCTICATGCEL